MLAWGRGAVGTAVRSAFVSASTSVWTTAPPRVWRRCIVEMVDSPPPALSSLSSLSSIMPSRRWVLPREQRSSAVAGGAHDADVELEEETPLCGAKRAGRARGTRPWPTPLCETRQCALQRLRRRDGIADGGAMASRTAPPSPRKLRSMLRMRRAPPCALHRRARLASSRSGGSVASSERVRGNACAEGCGGERKERRSAYR